MAWPFPLRIWDLVDIVVVGFIVYQILMLIRGTRAVQLVTGLGLLFLAYVASVRFGLYTLHWILSYIGLVVPIALLVLFQPELRRMLEQWGRGSVSLVGFTPHGLDREAAIRLVNDVARAARVLGSRKIGALIVIERRTGLEDFIETGIRVDAQVTVQLLISIFFPSTPLHDGAVIIRGNRLAAAGCLLPLSERPGIVRPLGTRHRAAIGLSELTDALAVVVSEETGTISLAVEGHLDRAFSEEELKVRLLELVGIPAVAGRSLRVHVPAMRVPSLRVPGSWRRRET